MTAPHHDEDRTVPSVDITLEEAGDLLGLMAKGVRRVNSTITVYHEAGKIQAEDPGDRQIGAGSVRSRKRPEAAHGFVVRGSTVLCPAERDEHQDGRDRDR